MGTTTSIIRVAILGEEKSLGEAVRKSNEHLDKLSKKAKTTGEKMTAGANKIVAAAAAGGLAIAGIAIKNGDELNEAEDQLDNAVERSHQSVKGLQKSIEPLQKRMERFGYTNKDVDESLTQLTRSGIKLKDAIKDEAIAADLSKAKHISLADATTIVAKASEGQLKPLKALAIDLPIAAGGALKLALANKGLAAAQVGVKAAEAGVITAQQKASFLIAEAERRHLKGAKAAAVYAKAHDLVAKAEVKLTTAQAKLKASQDKVTAAGTSGKKILSALANTVKNSAETSTKSLAGKTAELKAKFTDMTAHLGQKLIPIVIMLADKFMGMVDFFGKNRLALIALTAVVGVFTAAVVTLFIVDKVKKLTEAWTKAQAALNIVMDANPVVLVVAAIAALAAGIFIAYKKVGWFHDAVDKAWQVLQTGYHWVVSNWPLLLAILTGPIGLAVLVISRHWDTIVGFVKSIPGRIAGFAAGMWNGITNAFGAAKNWIGARGDEIVGWVQRLPGRIASAASNMWHGLTDAFYSAVGGIKRIWNDTVGKLLHGQGIGFSVLGHHIGASLPDLRMHTGGTFQAPFGQSEGLAILRNREVVSTPEQVQRNAMAAAAGAGDGGGSFTYNAPAGVNDRDVMRAVERYNRRNGRR